jgi:hypothetical protein
VPKVLKSLFWGADQNFSGPLMPFARGNMRDHIVSRKNDHDASYGRYAVLQWWSRLKISFCEIFGVVQFSTFATQSAQSGPSWIIALLHRSAALCVADRVSGTTVIRRANIAGRITFYGITTSAWGCRQLADSVEKVFLG